VTARRYDGMIHGFASMGGAIEQGKKVIADIAAGLRAAFAHTVKHAKQKVTTFLMFEGKAEEAMNYYISVFEQAEVVSIQRYGANEAGAEGTVAHAIFSLYGQMFMCIDSNVKHGFTFTPSISLYVACATEDEIERLFAKLSQGGAVAMPLMAYPFSEKFAWVADKYGVSWQLNLERS
jgi:predicted 3-demethylubiquinone-9 3-methyltransferase (glyoxalase superfamily)